MGCGASTGKGVAPVPSRHYRKQPMPWKLAPTSKVQQSDTVALNGYMCSSNAQASPLCSLRGVGEPVERLPSVIYTNTTVAGFDAMCNAAARQLPCSRPIKSVLQPVDPHEQQLVAAGQSSRRQRRASAPDRLSGADQLVEINAAGPTRRGQKADRGRVLRVAKLY